MLVSVIMARTSLTPTNIQITWNFQADGFNVFVAWAKKDNVDYSEGQLALPHFIFSAFAD